MGELTDQFEVLASGQLLVDGGVLPGETDIGSHLLGLFDHVEAQDLRRAFIGSDDRGEDPHHRGLAGAVGPQQSVDGTGQDREINAVDGLHLAESLGDPGHFDRRDHDPDARTGTRRPLELTPS
ncbi:hypothetical protein BH24ACT5_BH24ACT5_08950 [soil metagenome]